MLSMRVSNIAPAATIEISARIAELKRKGTEIISLNIGEPDFPTPDNVSQAAKMAIDAHFTKYQPVPGIPDLRESICLKLERDNQISYTPNEICVSAGAKQAVFNAVFVLCEEGNEVIIPTPCWVSYSEIVKLAGAMPVYVPCSAERGFDLDLDGIRAAITSRTKCVIINTPNNPTGAVYSEESLRALGELAIQHDFYIIADEIYEEMVYDGAKHVSIAALSSEIREQCITINGFSKAYSMPGWRVGYSAAPKEITSAMKAVQGHVTSAANSIAQKAAVEALKGPQETVASMCSEYARRRKRVAQLLEQMPGLRFQMPAGAFYFFVDVTEYLGIEYGGRKLETSIDLTNYLLDRAHIAVVPGEAFHMAGYMRLSYANSLENLERALESMAGALAELRAAAEAAGNRVPQ